MGAAVSAVELLPPGCGPGDDRWHELRRQGVTASEIAAVMGISPWESPFSCYWRKTNGWQWEGNELTETGRHLESAIAVWWELEHADAADPILHIRDAGLYAHPDRPWEIATPDRLVYGVVPGRPGVFRFDSLLECKWVAYSWDGWGDPGTDSIPVYYRAQCLWQADVMGVDEVHVAALGPGGFRAYVVRRDEDDLALMRKAGEDFHRRLTEGDPPPLDSHSATLTTLKRLHPTVGEGDVEVSADLADRYRHARVEKKSIEEYIDLCEAEIRAALGGTYARAVWDGRTVASRSVFEQRRIDVERLRRERPDVAAEYTVTTTVDRLNPGRSETHD